MLGINFGTSTISCAFIGECNVQPKIVGQQESSCVFFKRNNDAIVVGKEAEISKLSSQGHAIYDFKRLIGQKFAHDTIMDWQKAVPYVPIRQIYGGKPVFEFVQNGETKIKGTEQIMAEILTKIRQQAEKFHFENLKETFQPVLLKEEDIHLENVVLTVPACFKMTQKHAIEEAAKMAGFEKIQLLEESFAGGYNRKDFTKQMNEKELKMSVEELEEICAPICQKAIQTLMDLLREKEMDGPRLNKISVLSMGGTSRIPLIKQMLMQNGFNEQQLCTNFDAEIVAKGAAIFGSKTGKMLSPNCGQLLNGLDILLPSHSEITVLFPPGTSFPTGEYTISSPERISCQTTEDGQSCIWVEFYEHGVFLASVTVDGLPPESKAGTVNVDLEIGLTKNGLPHVELLQINPTNSTTIRAQQRIKRALPLEFGHSHGCQPTNSNAFRTKQQMKRILPTEFGQSTSSNVGMMGKKLIREEEIEGNIIPLKKPKMEDAERECPFCLYEFGQNDMRIFCEPMHSKEKIPQKRHSICAQCIIQNAAISVENGELAYGGAALPCMKTECANVLTLAQIRRILPKNILDQFEELALQYCIVNVGKLESCANCNFRMILESNPAEMRIFRCPECNFELCRKCKFQWQEHFGQTCEQLQEAERERIRLEEEKRSREEKMEKERKDDNSELYCATMKKLLFKTIPFYGANGALCMPYHFANSLKTPFAPGANTTKRLAKEIAEIHESLPISTKSSIFVRACEERLDVMKVLIIGPAGTPYANGCFEFDVFFNANYPNEPMKINFETTGGKSVRFNPNLYNCGKVCLSLLNTWTGSAAEMWNASKSTLLQVLVSIQGLIFVEDPFYNEPGYANMRNSAAGEKQSCEYNVNIRQMCVRWAMLQQLQDPPKAFADVIESHFWLKKEEICQQIEEWIEDFQSLVEAGKVSGFHSNLNELLKTNYEKLKTKFSAMKCPTDLQQIAVAKEA